MNSLVVVKFPQETRTVNVDFTDLLAPTELILSGGILVQGVDNILTAVPAAPIGAAVPVTLNNGTDGVSYGVNVTINTTLGHFHTKVIATVIDSQMAVKYQNKNVDAFQNLMGEIEAGEAAIGSASFMFPLPFQANNGIITWDLIDSEGVNYGSGIAYDYRWTNLSDSIKIEGSAVISTPSDLLPTLSGQNYQVRWKLQVNGQTYYSSEVLRVTAPNTVPEGTEDVVELEGNDIPVAVVLDAPYEHVQFEVYDQNVKVVNVIVAGAGERTADGWFYGAVIQAINLPAKLDAYTIVWTYFNSNSSDFKARQTGRIFVVNPSILQAVDDMRVLINKSRSTIAHAPDLLFTTPLLMSYLRRGRDAFNGAYGVLTGFTMINAQGSIREFWLKFSEVMAMRSQYLAEGEKVFNFSGQAISLDVDRTQYYAQLADNWQSILDNEAKPYKQGLITKGIIGGDGNLGTDGGTAMRPGANGSVGITITPASTYGSRFPASRWGIRF